MRAYDCEAEHIYAVTLSSELSGSYNSALLGRDLIMEDPQVFRGFVCGILSQNSDIEKIYIDGLNHIVDKVSDADFVKFIEELEKTSAEAETDMIMIISRKQDLLPAEVQKYLV